MAAATLLFVYCYDIADDKSRRTVARQLEKQAIRVQQSVFEWSATEQKAKRLARDLCCHLGSGDSLRVYALDRSGRGRSCAFGPGPQIADEPLLLY